MTSASLAAHFPQHAVSKWVGHSVAVSVKHYLTVTDDLFNAVAGLDGEDFQATEQATDRMETGGNERETVGNEGDTVGCVAGAHLPKPLQNKVFPALKRIEANGSRTRNHRIDSPVLLNPATILTR